MDILNAVREGKIETLKKLMKGKKKEYCDNDDGSLLVVAASRGNLSIVKFLIESKIECPSEDEESDSEMALIFAALSGKLNVVKYLVSVGVKVWPIALRNATINKHDDVSKYLEKMVPKSKQMKLQSDEKQVKIIPPRLNKKKTDPELELLYDYIGGDGKFRKIPKKLGDILVQSVDRKNYHLFRGFGFDNRTEAADWVKAEVSPKNKKYNLGDTFTLSSKDFTSWSTEKSIAESFAYGKMQCVIECTVNPKTVLADINNIAIFNTYSDYEVLVKGGTKIKVKIIEISDNGVKKTWF